MTKGIDNLKPIQSKEEARERGRIGGIKSGEARRRKRTLKEQLLLLLSDKKTQNEVCNALIGQAKIGNVKAFETIRDTIGEKPIDKVNQTGTVQVQKVFITSKDTEEIDGLIDDYIKNE